MSNNNQEDNQIEKETEGEDKDEEDEDNEEENEENEPEPEKEGEDKDEENEVINFNIPFRIKEEYPLRVIIPKPNYQILEPQLHSIGKPGRKKRRKNGNGDLIQLKLNLMLIKKSMQTLNWEIPSIYKTI
jgi:hypothetical protein